jgi:hypothetical protein
VSRVRKTAQLLADAVKSAALDLGVSVQHYSGRAGHSSYVHIDGHEFYRGARISDHAIGMKRFHKSAISLYLRPSAKPCDWSVWLSEVVSDWKAKQSRKSEASR